MGASRIDRTEDEWRNNGSKLLKRIKKQRKFHPTISKLLIKLETNNNDPEQIVNELNAYKDKLGDDWIKWAKTITQHEKDKKRKKFYVSELVYNQVMAFSKKSDHEGNITKSLSQLFANINTLGVNSVGDVYDLMELIKKFEDVVIDENIKSPLLTPNTNYKPTLSLIIKSIITELNKCGINNFRSLSGINNKKLEARRLEREMGRNKSKMDNELADLRSSIKTMENKLTDKNNKIAELNKQLNSRVDYKANKNDRTQTNLKRPKPASKNPLKNTISGLKPSKR